MGLDVLREEVRSMLLYVHKGHNIMDYEGRANPVVEFIYIYLVFTLMPDES